MLIGERLKSIREAKKMSQGDVEKATGLLRCYISRVENGHTVPALPTLEKWTKALDVSMSQLFADDGKEAKALPMLKNGHTPKLSKEAVNGLHQIQLAFGRMESRDIRIVVGMARKIAGAK